jgi:hypothetical protein
LSFTDSILTPRDIKTAGEAHVNEDPLTRTLYEVLSWFRGEMKLGKMADASITAGQTATVDIEPPLPDEEWEIFQVQVADGANIDVLDTVTMLYRDDSSALMNLLEDGNLRLNTTGTNQNAIGWPNRDTANPAWKINLFGVGLIVKRRDANTPWLRFRCLYVATATVGTRSVKVQFIYRRRRLS